MATKNAIENPLLGDVISDAQLPELGALFTKLEEQCNNTENMTNQEKQSLHRDLSLAEDILQRTVDASQATKISATALLQQLREAHEKAKLELRPRNHHSGVLLRYFLAAWSVVRMVSTALFAVEASVVVALPCLVLGVLEQVLHLPRALRLSGALKRFSANYFLAVIGVFVRRVADPSTFDNAAIVMFSHGSNLDPFIMLATFPGQLLCIAKKELFMMPFVGWLALALGGLPINRRDRKQAIAVLDAGAKVVGNGNFLAISPEGTRSRTGMLGVFKKGGFYLQESMKAHVIPCVNYGGYELWPRGQLFTSMGQMVVSYGPPVLPAHAPTREDMTRRVRECLLQQMAQIPNEAGAGLTLIQQFLHLCSLILLYSMVVLQYHMLIVIMDIHGYTAAQVTIYFLLFSVVSTAVIYIGYVKILYSPPRSSESTLKSSEVDKAE